MKWRSFISHFRMLRARRFAHCAHSNEFTWSGRSQDVEFHLSPRDLSMVTKRDIIVAQGKYTIAIAAGNGTMLQQSLEASR